MVRCVGQRPKEETEALAESTPVQRGLAGNSLTNRAVGFLPTIRSSRPSTFGPGADPWRAHTINGTARSFKQQSETVYSVHEPAIGLPGWSGRGSAERRARQKHSAFSGDQRTSRSKRRAARSFIPAKKARIEAALNSVFSWRFRPGNSRRQVNHEHHSIRIDVRPVIEKSIRDQRRAICRGV
jgi:hypothetical protein